MQHRIHLARENINHAVAFFPRRAKPVGIVAAAEEARAVSGRQRSRLIQEEQLGPAARAHHLAPPAPEFADAGDPDRGCPALFQQGLCRGVVDDAAIAGEHSAMRIGDDVARWRDPVLKGHWMYSHFTEVSQRVANGEWRMVPPFRYSLLAIRYSPSLTPRRRGSAAGM